MPCPSCSSVCARGYQEGRLAEVAFLPFLKGFCAVFLPFELDESQQKQGFRMGIVKSVWSGHEDGGFLACRGGLMGHEYS
ncbi:hypothetical protein D7X48_18200 [bacterium D16-50]|nr:hypothetical protein D7X48_18200 [bacterium D16-50]